MPDWLYYLLAFLAFVGLIALLAWLTRHPQGWRL